MEQNTELGQHFMKDKELLERIVQVGKLTPQDDILEIGSGDGALTTVLKKHGLHVRTLELDERFQADIHGNALELIEALAFDVVVANLPYHISEPLFAKFSFVQPRKVVVVVGERFAQKLLGETIIGEVWRNIYDCQLIETIPPEAFEPPPRVLSALVISTLKDTRGPLADFYQYPKSKVKNYLKTKTMKRQAQEFINKLPLPLQEKRLYELTTEEFLQFKTILLELIDHAKNV